MCAISEIKTKKQWFDYSANPSRQNFQALMAVVRPFDVIEILYSQFIQGKDWRIAQHLSIVFLRVRHFTGADYFARTALRLSGGNVWARLTLTSILWERRLPEAVFFQAILVRLQLRRIKNRDLRKIGQRELAEIMLKTYAYSLDIESARKYLKLLLQFGFMRTDTAVRLLFGARSANATDLYIFAARQLAQRDQQLFGGRLKGAIRQGVRLSFCQCLRAKDGK